MTTSFKLGRSTSLLSSLSVFSLLATLLWVIFPAEASAQSVFSFSDGNRMAIITCDFLRLTEGNLGSLVMVCAGLGALIAAAGGNYKVGYSLLAVAVFAFTLRAGVLIFFDANIADCEEDGNQQTGRSAIVKSQAREGAKGETSADSYWNSLDSKPETATVYGGRSGSTRLARRAALNGDGGDKAKSSSEALQALNSADGGTKRGSTISAVSASGFDCSIDFQLSANSCIPKGASVDVHLQVKSSSGGKCWPCNLEIQSADLGYHSDPLLSTALSDVVAVPDNISSSGNVTFTASAYGCGPKVPQLPAESITLPVCGG